MTNGFFFGPDTNERSILKLIPHIVHLLEDSFKLVGHSACWECNIYWEEHRESSFKKTVIPHWVSHWVQERSLLSTKVSLLRSIIAAGLYVWPPLENSTMQNSLFLRMIVFYVQNYLVTCHLLKELKFLGIITLIVGTCIKNSLSPFLWSWIAIFVRKHPLGLQLFRISHKEF